MQAENNNKNFYLLFCLATFIYYFWGECFKDILCLKKRRLTTLRESNEAENGDPQLQNKRGILNS
jgi:hypothetical protein